ncbi:MAG: enoyl-CoA hydratase/isomerase family protein [Polyangiaceae bacterium]
MLTTRVSDGIARIELCRPDRHNAIDLALGEALARAAVEVESAGSDVRCVVLSGAGRSFCSGADLRMLREMDSAGARRFMLEAAWTFRRFERLPVPVIAAAKGYCLGGGFELLLHCDLVIASTDAAFGFPEVPLGLLTTTGAVDRLARAIGAPRARDMLLTGRRVSGAEAAAMGLVARLAEPGELDAATDALAKQLAAQPPESLAAMKGVLARRHGVESAGSWIDEVESFEGLLARKLSAPP